MAWYKEWFGEEYLELYAHRDRAEASRHVEFVEELFEGEPRAILDLACGAGRHTEALRRRGHRTLGTDLSLTLLATRSDLPRVAADMRRLPFADAAFDWLLNFFTSFGYFEGERENFRVLEEIVRVLEPGGRFLVDLMNLEYTLDNLVDHEVRRDEGREVEIHRWWDRESRRINKRIEIAERGTVRRSYLESVRGYRPDEVTVGLGWAGLEVDELFGDFDGAPFTATSPRLILVGHKPRARETMAPP